MKSAVVLEVGVAEVPQGRPLGAERAAVAREALGMAAVEPVSCGVMGCIPPWWRPRAGGVRPPSLRWARQASGICGGEGTAMGRVEYDVSPENDDRSALESGALLKPTERRDE